MLAEGPGQAHELPELRCECMHAEPIRSMCACMPRYLPNVYLPMCTFQTCTFAGMLTEVYLYALTSGQTVRADWVVQAVVPAARLCWLKS